MIKLKNYLLSGLFALLIFTPSVRAEEVATSEDALYHHWSLSISPRYFHNQNNHADSAFLNNGFSVPKHDLFGMDFKAIRYFESGFRAGLELGGVATTHEDGANQATLSTGYFGAFVGQDLAHWGDTSLYLGTGLGFSSTQIEIFSAVQNGRNTETAFYIQPTLGIDHLVSHFFKIGLSGTYFVTAGESSKIVGQDFGMRDISPRGFTAQVDFMFGRF